MTDRERIAVASCAIAAPLLHTLTDMLEWGQGGFSALQLWLNYVAFLPMPVLLIGLYVAQRPRLSQIALLGAIAYGFAFVYFAHTTLVALEQGVATYEELWAGLGVTYTVHGALMVLGGLMFGVPSLRAGVLPRAGPALFVVGLLLNLGVALVSVPELWQIGGTALRNLGLVAMGWALLRHDPEPRAR